MMIKKNVSLFGQQRIFFILVVFGNFILFGYVLHKDTSQPICSVTAIARSAVSYLLGNDIYPVEHFLGNCLKVGVSPDLTQALRKSVLELLDYCKKMKKKKVLFSSQVGPKPFVTLFTTHASHNHSEAEKVLVHNNTMQNWAALKPWVRLVLFTNSSDDGTHAEQMGWETLPIIHHKSGGVPILKNMFLDIITQYNSTWYGYVNADILFTGDLLTNLEAISEHFLPDSVVLVTGQRTNIGNISETDLSDFNKIKAASESHSLYRIDAEDYFLTTRNFPWKNIPDLVVGRAGYDNWLVGHARCALQVQVVDASQTLLAVHQTTVEGGNQESFKRSDSNYNYDLFKQLKIKPNYMAGLTTCTEWLTYNNLCQMIEVTQRENLANDKGCKCKKT